MERTKDNSKEVWQLRQAWSRSKRRFAVLKRAKIDTNQYKCEQCGGVFKYRDITVDHRIPCVDPVLGWQGVGEFAKRLYCEVEGLQALCLDLCHKAKTKKETKVRRANA